jgi:hypothetical protein
MIMIMEIKIMIDNDDGENDINVEDITLYL